MAVSFQDTLIRLDNLGLRDVILPFVLIFTITFAILQRTGIFGDAKKEGRKFNTIFAMVMGLIVVVPHVLGQYPSGYDVVQIINSSLPGISLVMVIIISLLLVMATFGLDKGFKKSSGIAGFFTLLSFVAVVGIFGTSLGWWQLTGIFSFLNDPDLQAMVIVMAFFWIIISFVTGNPEEATKKKNLFKQIGELIEGGDEGGSPPCSLNMATFLDLSSLTFFSPVFAGVFIMLAVFAVLNKTKVIGPNAAIQWVAAIMAGLMFASVQTLTRTFEIAAPWTIMLIILIMFINLTTLFMGAEGEDLPLNPKNLSVMTIFAILVATIFFVSLGQAMHEKKVALEAQGVTPTETFGGQLAETIRTPAVLGLILVFLIATFTVLLLAAKH